MVSSSPPFELRGLSLSGHPPHLMPPHNNGLFRGRLSSLHISWISWERRKLAFYAVLGQQKRVEWTWSERFLEFLWVYSIAIHTCRYTRKSQEVLLSWREDVEPRHQLIGLECRTDPLAAGVVFQASLWKWSLIYLSLGLCTFWTMYVFFKVFDVLVCC